MLNQWSFGKNNFNGHLFASISSFQDSKDELLLWFKLQNVLVDLKEFDNENEEQLDIIDINLDGVNKQAIWCDDGGPSQVSWASDLLQL